MREPVLVGWAAGPRGGRLSGRSRSTQVSAAIATLAKVFRKSRAEIEDGIDAIRAIDWGEDPWTRGGYCVIPVGGKSAQEDLQRPVEGTLFFTGEALNPPHMGTVHGAAEAGEITARRLLASL